MPTIEREQSTVHYDLYGDGGPPLLLFNGIGFANWSWYRQLPELSSRCRVVAPENRGCGHSPWNGQPFTMEDLADDGAAVLDELAIEAAHVFGLSMGGFIAQEFALRHPQRVLSLQLGCTHCGAPEAEFMAPDVAARMHALARLGWTEEGVRASLDLNFSPEFIAGRPDFLDDYVQKRMANAPTTEGWMAQRGSSLTFRSFPRLGTITAPTCILHGDADPVVPSSNALILAHAIPGARLEMFPNGRHGFFLEQAEAVNRCLLQTIFRS